MPSFAEDVTRSLSALASSTTNGFAGTVRNAFSDSLEQQFQHRTRSGVAFLLITLQLRENATVATRLLLEALPEVLTPSDDFLVDQNRQCIIVLLVNPHPRSTRRFFRRLKNHLNATHPERADAILESFSTIVIPEGCGYASAEAALDDLLH